MKREIACHLEASYTQLKTADVFYPDGSFTLLIC